MSIDAAINSDVSSQREPGPGWDEAPDSFWRALAQLNHFRLFVAFAMAVMGLAADEGILSLRDPQLFAGVCASYFLLAWVFIVPMRNRVPSFEAQVVRHVIVDIVGIGLMLHLSGSGPAGPGLLLIVSMGAVGMLRQRRQVLFWAALASLVLLAQQFALVLKDETGLSSLARGGVLAASFFGVAMLAHIQASAVRVASRLARDKGQQAENLARLNARMIQELPYAVLAVDGQGEVLQYNARVEELLGTRIFPHSDLRQCAPQLAELWSRWRRQQAIPPHPFQAGKDGHRLIPRFIELEPSRQEGAVVVLDDMTDMEAQAQRMKLASLGMLTANLAHEIRNPLSAIRHAAGLLREDAQDAVGSRLTGIIESNAQRLNRLVEDVLALNRRDRLAREDLALAEVVPRFLHDFCLREQVPDEIVLLHLSGDPHLCMDAGHLEQILWNLLRNAWRYCTKQPGSIRIRVCALAERVDIDVINDGPAIPAETRTRLFEPFYTTSKQGTGLGLYIARDLAEANGGSLGYMEIADGTLFRLSGQATPCKEKQE
ncbi:MAG: HAMP domain-containing sensor histidine kinase [Pseudomonadota bacterium]